MDFFQGFQGLPVVVKRVCTEHGIERVVFKRQPFSTGDLESEVPQAACRPGDFNHPGRYVHSIEHAFVMGEGRDLANGLARSATEVQEANPSLDIEIGNRFFAASSGSSRIAVGRRFRPVRPICERFVVRVQGHHVFLDLAA